MNAALRLQGLRKAYGDVIAVDGIDLLAMPGECLGILGPNGAGKTTTIEICEGLLAPDGGTVEVLGLNWQRDARELRERLGVQLQETQLSEKLTVLETLRLFQSFYRRASPVDEVIDLVTLGEKRDARVGQLSGGQKQRLALACALVGDPDLLFLDEPTTGLDPQARRQIWELIERFKRRGRSIVLTTHYMEEAERIADCVAIMDHGHVIALGTPRELTASLGVDQIIELTITRGPPSDALRLEAEGIRGVRLENGVYVLEAMELHRSLPALLASLERQGIELGELRTHGATLEDVFVNLTGRHLRGG